MATLPLIRYPLDPSGTSLDNKVVGEVHTLVHRTIRVCAPTYGAFFTESVKVKDLSTNTYLDKGVQFYAAELYEVPTAKFGKEICAIIVITDQSVSDNISLEYQALGGEFSAAADAVINQILALQNDNRPVEWGQVIAKPSEYPPSHHLHDLGDIYGFEYLVHSIDRLRAAILLGDDYAHDTIYQYVDSLKAGIQALISGNSTAIQDHIGNLNNPHQVTAAQVGAYTKAQIDALNTALNSLITNHAADHNNPHAVTAAQLGVYQTWQTYTTTETTALVQSKVDALRTDLQNQINLLNSSLSSHINNTNNPHGTFPAQIGTYTSAQIDAKIAAGAGGAIHYSVQSTFNGWSLTAAAPMTRGMAHFVTSDDASRTTNVFLNGGQVSGNVKQGGAGYGRNHHDVVMFNAGDTISFSCSGSGGFVHIFYW